MMTGTLSRYFAMRFFSSVHRHFCRRGRARRHDRLFRIDAPRRRLAEGNGMDTGRDFDVPDSAAHRAHHAVCGAGGRDVVLFDAVAPPRTGDCARRRHLRLAIRGAGRARGVPVRHGRYRRLQSDRRDAARALEAPGIRKCWTRRLRRCRRAAADSGCGKRAPMERPSSTPSRAANKAPASAGSPFTPSTSAGHFQRADRGKKRRTQSKAIGSSTTRAFIRPTAPPQLAGHLPAQHQSDPRTGAGELRHARNSAVLATSQLYRDGGQSGPRRRRLSVAIQRTAGPPLPALRHGLARRRREPAVLSLRRRAKDGLSGITAGFLLFVLSEDHRGHEQIGADGAARWRPGSRSWSAASPVSLRCCTRRTDSTRNTERSATGKVGLRP